jgi:GLPGLI family protein
MKNLAILFVLSFICISQHVFAQQVSSVEYKEYSDLPEVISLGTPIYKLVFNPDKSMYYQTDFIKTKSSIMSSVFSRNTWKKEKNFTIKFYDSKKLMVLSEMINDQVILVSDSLQLIKWNIQKSKPIRYLGLDCYQAKGNFRGRNYTAYFAPKIKKSDGPFKFSGLPGLIIKIASDDKFIIWQAIKINYNAKEMAQIPEKFKGKPISFASYVKLKKNADKQFIKEEKAKNPPQPGESYEISLSHVEKTLELE